MKHLSSRLRAVVAIAALTAGAMGIARADHGSNSGGSKSSTTTGVRLRAPLTGPAISGKTPRGEAEFRNNPARLRSSLEVEVENVNLPAGTVLTVTLTQGTAAAVTLGTITLNAEGEGELELSSQDGAVIPVIVAGNVITVLNGTTNVVIGTF